VVEACAPTSDQIITAINTAFPPSSSTWIGPQPRITRTANVGQRFATTVTWVFYLPDGTPNPAATAATVGQALANTLGTISNCGVSSNWDTPTVTAYDPALNGDLSTFWQSGTAAATMTRDSFPTMGGRLAANENAMGPNTPSTTLPTIGQGINQQGQNVLSGGPNSPIQQTTSLLTTVAWVALGGVALYLLWPVLSGLRSGERSVVSGPQARAERHARIEQRTEGLYNNPSPSRALPSRRRASRSSRSSPRRIGTAGSRQRS
jgi:hypothetical protein